MLRSWPLLFIVIPLVELYLIIEIGSRIGALWTVLIVLLTAVVGVQLLRIQGFSTLQRAQQSMARGALPAMEMMEGMVLAVGGALLITPGFLTDALGLLCLIPATRRAMIRLLFSGARLQVHTRHQRRGRGPFDQGPFDQGPFDQGRSDKGPSDQGPSGGRKPPRGGRTLEGEFHRKDP